MQSVAISTSISVALPGIRISRSLEMAEMSELLSEAIDSIIDVKEESDIDSLFKRGGTTALLSQVSGLDDFELICFLVVK